MKNIKIKAGQFKYVINILQKTKAIIQELKMNEDTARGLAYISKYNKFQRSINEGYKVLYSNDVDVVIDNSLPYNEVQIKYKERTK